MTNQFCALRIGWLIVAPQGYCAPIAHGRTKKGYVMEERDRQAVERLRNAITRANKVVESLRWTGDNADADELEQSLAEWKDYVSKADELGELPTPGDDARSA